MRDAREEILGRLRARLGRSGGEPGSRPEPLRPPAPRPAVRGEPVLRFVERAEAAAAEVVRLENPGEIPGAVARALARHELPPAVAVGSDPDLRGLPWDAVGVLLESGRPTTAALTRAVAGLAETGTLVLAGGPDNPMLSNFLPDHHFVVLDAGEVVAHQEEVWERYRERPLPRALTFVTGPSRTGDIEFTLQLGAHGPRHLHVLLVGGPSLPATSPC